MSLISTYGNGIRYLDNLITLISTYDGLCYSGFARTFDATQSITFPLTDVAGYYLIYYDYSVNEYVQEDYSDTFSKVGTFSNFIVWNRMLSSIELSYINKNIEFIYINNDNIVSIEEGAPISLDFSECMLWVPMLPTENAIVMDYISKDDATIANYDVNTILSDENVGPQFFAYSDELKQKEYEIYIRDNIIRTNLILPRLQSWSVEEVVDGNHLVYTYNYNNSTIITYLNGDAIGINTYIPIDTELQIGNTTFEGGKSIIDVIMRSYYVIYGTLLNKTQIKDLYAIFLMRYSNTLTLKEGTIVLTTNLYGEIVPLIYNPLLATI